VQLKKQAKNLGIPRYSGMNKTQLINAIALRQSTGSKQSGASKTTVTKSNNSNVANFNKWAKNLEDKVLGYRGGPNPILYVYKNYVNRKNEIDKNTVTRINNVNKIPNDTLSIVMYTPYKDDPDFANSHFYKLSTCMPTCSNHGIFEVDELNNLIDMSGTASTKCPFCSEPFKFSKLKSKPPFGVADLYIYNHNFFEIYFKMQGGYVDVNGQPKAFNATNRSAFIPRDAPNSLLAVYMYLQAWEQGKLFTIGNSVTNSSYFGITFAGIHMKTSTTGGLANHGYSSNFIKDFNDSVLPNLISECNAVGIFTPMQLDDFAKQQSPQTNQTSTKISASKRSSSRKPKRSSSRKPKRSSSRKPKRSSSRKPKRSSSRKPRRSSSRRPRRSSSRKPKRSTSRRPRRSTTSRKTTRQPSRKTGSSSQYTANNLKLLTKTKLVEIAKRLQIRGRTRMKKNMLIQKILSTQRFLSSHNATVRQPTGSTGTKKTATSKKNTVVSTNVQDLEPQLKNKWDSLRNSLTNASSKTKALSIIKDICVMLAKVSVMNLPGFNIQTANGQPGVQLNDTQHIATQQIIYETIAITVTKITDLENLVGVLPVNGKIDLLIHYLAPMTQFEVMQQLSLSAKDYGKLVVDILKDLQDVVSQTKTALQQYIAQMIKKAPEIIHAASSPFAEDLITWKSWNNMGYTQLKPKNKPPGRKREIKACKWSCKEACDYINNKKNKLDEIANFEVDGNSNEVLLFHGSGGVAKSSLQKSIDWKRGNGYLGKGFYMTFNPNEAKIYACRAANETNSDNALVLEIVIKNAKQFFQKDGGYWDSSIPGHFCRNNRNDNGGWWDQINVRDDIISNMEIRRIHIIPRKSLKHYGSSANPNTGGGYYTVQRKKNKGVYCKK
jgi:hypothetical protein